MPTAKQLADARTALQDFDWTTAERLSDVELREAWSWDGDSVWPSDEELEQFSTVTSLARAKAPEAAE